MAESAVKRIGVLTSGGDAPKNTHKLKQETLRKGGQPWTYF